MYFQKSKLDKEGILRWVWLSHVPCTLLPPNYYKELTSCFLIDSCVPSYKDKQIYLYFLISPSFLHIMYIQLMLLCTLLYFGKMLRSELLGKGKSTVLLVKLLSSGVLSFYISIFSAWRCFSPHSFAPPKKEC